MKRFVTLALVLSMAACTNGGGSVTTDHVPGVDTIGGDATLDLVHADAAPDTAPDTEPEDTAPDCDKLCEQVECGLAGPDDVCDCGGCDESYACSDEGLCTADCGALCEDLECGVAGAMDECECGTCEEGYGCSDAGACLADCEALCDGLECGPAGLDDECECGTCDDENVCTGDACLIDGTCSFSPVADDAPCDDGDLCTDDGCQAGNCVGVLVDCDDETYCTDDSCDPETGDCVNAPNALFCDDEDPCTIGDVCTEGACAGTPVDCTCAVDEDCLQFEDGDLCNGVLFCDTAFLPWQCAVVEDSIVECPEPEEGPDAACLMPSCDPETGACDVAPDNEGMACEDGDACTVGDACVEGACLGGPAANCNDGDVCTDDS